MITATRILKNKKPLPRAIATSGVSSAYAYTSSAGASIDVLNDSIRLFFSRNGVSAFSAVFASSSREDEMRDRDLVFYGEPPLCLEAFDPPLVLDRSYRIWVLSTRLKRLLVSFFSFDPKQIGVIPRYELFPVKKHPPRKATLLDAKRVVYAGRASSGKNLELLSRWCNYAGKKLEAWPEGFLWVGPVPKGSEPLPRVASRYYRGDMGVDWAEKIARGTAFISFSTLTSEDFSVASAQAQANGMVVACPDWNGFGDLYGRGVGLFSARLIAKMNRGIIGMKQFTDEILAASETPRGDGPPFVGFPEWISGREIAGRALSVPREKASAIREFYTKGDHVGIFANQFRPLTKILAGESNG